MPEYPVFPQSICRHENGECAFVGSGKGLTCQECDRYLHPGDDDFLVVSDYYEQLKQHENAKVNLAHLPEETGP